MQNIEVWVLTLNTLSTIYRIWVGAS